MPRRVEEALNQQELERQPVQDSLKRCNRDIKRLPKENSGPPPQQTAEEMTEGPKIEEAGNGYVMGEVSYALHGEFNESVAAYQYRSITPLQEYDTRLYLSDVCDRKKKWHQQNWSTSCPGNPRSMFLHYSLADKYH